jgi:hypothetical protein
MVKIAKFVIPPPQNTTRAAKDTYRRRKQAPLAQGASGDRPVTAWGASAVYPQKTDELSIPKKVSSSANAGSDHCLPLTNLLLIN